MTDEQLVQEGIAAAREITAASRRFRNEEEYPRVVVGYVMFHDGDRRFHIYDATIIYVEDFLQENRVTLEQACNNERLVRELIEVITS